MTFFNTSEYPGFYTQIGVIQPFLSYLCGNPKVPDILTRLEDVEVLDFIYENSLNPQKPYTIHEEYDDYYNNEEEEALPEVPDEENEVKNDNKDPPSPIDLRKSSG